MNDHKLAKAYNDVLKFDKTTKKPKNKGQGFVFVDGNSGRYVTPDLNEPKETDNSQQILRGMPKDPLDSTALAAVADAHREEGRDRSADFHANLSDWIQHQYPTAKGSTPHSIRVDEVEVPFPEPDSTPDQHRIVSLPKGVDFDFLPGAKYGFRYNYTNRPDVRFVPQYRNVDGHRELHWPDAQSMIAAMDIAHTLKHHVNHLN